MTTSGMDALCGPLGSGTVRTAPVPASISIAGDGFAYLSYTELQWATQISEPPGTGPNAYTAYALFNKIAGEMPSMTAGRAAL